MKKIVAIIIMSVILLCSIGLLLYVNNGYQGLKKENKNLENEISEVTKNINTQIEDNANYEAEIATLEEENSAKIKEQNIWLKMKEKLNQALS